MPTLKRTKDQQREIAIKKLFVSALIEKGWTQAHLAMLLGKDRSVVGRAINHPLKREFRVLLQIADKLNVNLADALTEKK